MAVTSTRTDIQDEIRRGSLPISAVTLKIKEALEQGNEHEAWRWLIEFADDFRGSTRKGQKWLISEPSSPIGDNRYDSAIAALVEYLCSTVDIASPPWTNEEYRFACPWWFHVDSPIVRARAIRESPISFKRHGVFICAGAFDSV
ncbi:MAG: hypothetical protein M1483_00325 [Actinobacteria bacterium]|nr:hypothetical protein [Actinomycetota bacterium]MCL6104082.1 hypothetical protein [Actinomycetota bacterium]